MTITLKADSMEELYRDMADALRYDYDFESSPRGKPIREILGATFVLRNPRNRLILSPARNVNFGFAVGELCWYIRGDSDLETMLYYNKRMSQFSDDGKTINSAYGARMFTDEPSLGNESQFYNCCKELLNDPASRRAVMHINQPRDLFKAVSKSSKDVPCTMSLQLLIRDKKLYMHVLMRSNDFVWGVPYDFFSFTCLQELFLYQLQEFGVDVEDLGHYVHTSNSFHVYEPHYEMIKRITDESFKSARPMASLNRDDMLNIALHYEEAIRKNNDLLLPDDLSKNNFSSESSIWMMTELLKHKTKRQNEAKKEDTK